MLLQANSVRLMVSMPLTEAWIWVVEGGVDVPLSALEEQAEEQVERCSSSSLWMSALYWLDRASSYCSVHWRILLSQPSAVFSSSPLVSVVEL